MCYNPSIGQSCCADNGYCDRGQYCAPVAGYCCLDSEDLQTCATNAGFQLPPSALPANASTSVGGPTATTGVRPTGSGATGTGGGAPQVQVSAVGRREQWTLAWMAMGIGIVGVIMTTF
ncbi:hypothetical protein SBRCBS47491_000012 [Sporothrix bragantina]|uniref:Granulins domain-containing protein n=1 Tax=Sporothrix bragantina TaxID=671064 RepID=A0ABP0AK41_9PEZI